MDQTNETRLLLALHRSRRAMGDALIEGLAAAQAATQPAPIKANTKAEDQGRLSRAAAGPRYVGLATFKGLPRRLDQTSC